MNDTHPSAQIENFNKMICKVELKEVPTYSLRNIVFGKRNWRQIEHAPSPAHDQIRNPKMDHILKHPVYCMANMLYLQREREKKEVEQKKSISI